MNIVISSVASTSSQDQATEREAVDGLPIPPPELIDLVACTPDVGWYFQFGRACFQIMREILEKHDAPMEEMQRVLEFGCGCARVFRYWHKVNGPVAYGCDRDPKMVTWCQQSLPFGRYYLSELEPPSAYEAETFDFVYSIAVFTHLSELLQLRWMNELRRVLKPGGYLLLSTHGASYRHTLSASEQKLFDGGHVVVRDAEGAGTNQCGTYHPESYIRTKLAQGYRVVDFIQAHTREFIYHDLSLLSKG